MYNVEGYEFETKEQAQTAQQEAEQIEYLKGQTTMDDPDVVLSLYNKLVQRGVFSTQVGLSYLLTLRAYLDKVPYIKEEDILPLPDFSGAPGKPVEKAPEQDEASMEEALKKVHAARGRMRQEKLREKEAQKAAGPNYRRLFHISTFFAVVFAVAAIGMIVITCLTKDNVNIFNYENAIIDKYESWEQELDAREAELNEREQLLNTQEGLE
jgi:hypothetical protein